MSATATPDYRETIRQEWTGAAPLWKKWDHKLTAQSRAATDLVVRAAELAPGMKVLDLASGTGQPALSIAQAVGPSGRVVATDLVPEMLETASANARAQGITHMDFHVADAEQLPFPDSEFDRATCRFGLMFFPDAQKSLQGIRRVLKPQARVSFLVWGGLEENPFFSTALGPFLKRAQVPPPPPDAPHVFRYADPEKLRNALDSAGFREVQAQKRQIPWQWPGPPEEAWQAVKDLAAPFQKLIASLSADQREAAIDEALKGFRALHDGEKMNTSATVVMATAVA